MGVFETTAFGTGIKSLRDAVVTSTAAGKPTVIDGGDTATTGKKCDTVNKITHCSTGGGLRPADRRGSEGRGGALQFEEPSATSVARLPSLRDTGLPR